jgi:hypothetical protein
MPLVNSTFTPLEKTGTVHRKNYSAVQEDCHEKHCGEDVDRRIALRMASAGSLLLGLHIGWETTADCKDTYIKATPSQPKREARLARQPGYCSSSIVCTLLPHNNSVDRHTVFY